MQISAFSAAAALLALAVPARAQVAAAPADTPITVVSTVAVAPADTTPRTSLQKGNWSLSFSVPALSGGGGSGEIGAWEMIGSRTNLGLTLGLAVVGNEAESQDSETTQAVTSVDLGVNVKRYVTAPGEVTPFLLGGAGVGGRFERREGYDGLEEDIRGATGSVRGALGVEWFPVRRVSISGQTGFLLQAARYTVEHDLPDGRHVEGENRTMSFNTFTSALTLQIWF